MLLCLPMAPSPPHGLRSPVVIFATLQDPAPPAEGCCQPAQHCCKRKLPAFPPEVTSNAPSGARSPAGEWSGGTPAAPFSQCPPPPFPQGSRAAEEPAPPCPMYRLVLAGDSGTGKSSFLMRLCMNEFRDVSATLGTRAEVEGQGHREPGLTAPPGRGGLPDKAAAGGWGANYTADLGHSRAGEVSRASQNLARLPHPAGRAGRSPQLAPGWAGVLAPLQ